VDRRLDQREPPRASRAPRRSDRRTVPAGGLREEGRPDARHRNAVKRQSMERDDRQMRPCGSKLFIKRSGQISDAIRHMKFETCHMAYEIWRMPGGALNFYAICRLFALFALFALLGSFSPSPKGVAAQSAEQSRELHETYDLAPGGVVSVNN